MSHLSTITAYTELCVSAIDDWRASVRRLETFQSKYRHTASTAPYLKILCVHRRESTLLLERVVLLNTLLRSSIMLFLASNSAK